MIGKISAGVIGLGRMGRRHVQAYLQNPEIKLDPCCDANPEALRFLDTRNAPSLKAGICARGAR
jgi:predicted dehydrogenase